MGAPKAIVFGFFAMFPGAFLALMAYIMFGAPEQWSAALYLVCYGPFFGCIAIGIWLGLADPDAAELAE